MSYTFISEKNCVSKHKQLRYPINLSLMHIPPPCLSRKSIQPINVLENGKENKKDDASVWQPFLSLGNAS